MLVSVGSRSRSTRRNLSAGGQNYDYFSLEAAEREGLGEFSRLPASLAVVLENLLRFRDDSTVTVDDISAFSDWCANGGRQPEEIGFRPGRVLMQDLTGVPAVVDLAAMRDGIASLGGDPRRINPLVPVDLVVDHSVMVDQFGTPRAFQLNVEREYERNMERYKFLKWGQGAFDNFRVVPPGTGICHQVNLEFLSRTILTGEDSDGTKIAYPDTLVGTDSHTTMVNGLAVLGWGVGGIEAEAAMLGQPVSMLIPEVIGFELTGEPADGTTATDLVLLVVKMLRDHGVVGKFVEFFGDGLASLSIADRATIANMAPEYGATCGFFPVDNKTLHYLAQTGRPDELTALVERYARENRLWHGKDYNPIYTDRLHLDMSEVVPAVAGPKRPQDHTPLADAAAAFESVIAERRDPAKAAETEEGAINQRKVAGEEYRIGDGSIVIASITSCTNTSNPQVMLAAGLVARKARNLGLNRRPWVKTSLAPGSKVVTEYLQAAGLQEDLDALGFNLVGYGCTTCIGNSGPLQEEISSAISDGGLVAVSVLSGNRNFEGRISPDVRANYLVSPPLVVAYALAGNMRIDLTREPLGTGTDGRGIFLRDIWPNAEEINDLMDQTVTRDAFVSKYSDVFSGDAKWQAVHSPDSLTYDWPPVSTYVRNPPYFDGLQVTPPGISDIVDARVLAVLGDMVTTDHISPAGAFPADSPAGHYLRERQVAPREFNSYGSRRGNHEVMMRGTFANIRIRNELLEGIEGGYALSPDGERVSVFEAAMAYKSKQVPLVVFGGKLYGTGSSRDWAAKGTNLLGIKAVIAESFERIHRSNLVGMGVLPLELPAGVSRHELKLSGDECVSVTGLAEQLKPSMTVTCTITYSDGHSREMELLCRVDTEVEADYVRHGGVLHYVLRNLAAA
ncbi:MAG: aconitate hydratase AcnA [Rhodobacteraceae bacterium]|nr:aconitate hydratase AcnA [Paracoccaceae bacterium]